MSNDLKIEDIRVHQEVIFQGDVCRVIAIRADYPHYNLPPMYSDVVDLLHPTKGLIGLVNIRLIKGIDKETLYHEMAKQVTECDNLSKVAQLVRNVIKDGADSLRSSDLTRIEQEISYPDFAIPKYKVKLNLHSSSWNAKITIEAYS